MSAVMKEESTALVVVEELNLPALFAGDGMEALLARIENEVRSHVPDVSTAKGRKEIASLAHKVARSKTALDDAGKNLVADLKDRVRVVDQHRKAIRDRLDELKEEARRPLTEFEKAEQARIATHRSAIASLYIETPTTSAGCREAIADLESVVIGEHWEEFANEAAAVRDDQLRKLRGLLAEIQRREVEQEELARLRKEAAERAQRDREEAIRREAAEKAQREAEAKAQAEKEAAERAAKAEREAAERRELELKLAAEKAEREKLAAIQAAKDEAERLAREAEAKQRAIAEEKARREADLAHRAAIDAAAVDRLVQGGIDEKTAKAVIELIAAGEVPNVQINY